MGDISNVVPIVPVSLVCHFFLENIDKKLIFSDIENGCRLILQSTKIKGAPVIETAHSTRKKAVSEAVSLILLRGMIKESNGIFTCNDAEIHLLQYYANALKPWL